MAAMNQALAAGWSGFEIAERFSLDNVAQAHEFIEHPAKPGRMIVIIQRVARQWVKRSNGDRAPLAALLSLLDSRPFQAV